MGTFMNQSRLSLGGSDVTTYLHGLNHSHSQADLEATVFGNTYKARTYGLQDMQSKGNLHWSVTDNEIDEIMEALFGSAAIAVQYGYLQSATETTSNPEYNYTAMLLNLDTGGGAGELAEGSFSVAITTSTLTRDVT
jgi:hypothetical protein